MTKCPFRALAVFLLALLLALPLAMPLSASPTVSGNAACLYLPQNNSFIFKKNADARLPMASTTKIMTALTVLEHTDLEEVVTVSRAAAGIEGSSAYLQAGNRFTVEDLLYALLLASANDAATALAIHVAGSEQAFADLMNEKAQELSLKDTHFTNPHGLYDPAHYTTAAELAIISAAAMENGDFTRIAATKSKVITSEDGETVRTLFNHNKLLRSYPDCIGIKTGFTKDSGRCLVSAAEREGLLLIAVTLDAPNDWQDHTAMLDFGFSVYKGYCVAESELSFKIPVVSGAKEDVTLSPLSPLTLVLPKAAGTPSLSLEINRFAVAPIRRGATLGMATYTLDGKIIARVPLIAKESIAAVKPKENLFDKFKHLFNL